MAYSNAMFMGMFSGLMMLLLVPIYVYWALVWMTIAKKLNYDKPWLAWVPIANMFLLPILAEKHWAWGFILLVPLVNIVFIILWLWHIYEKRNYPGWLSLVMIAGIIPLLNIIAGLANIVIMGLVAWVDR